MTPERADRRDAVARGAGDVVFAVAHHDGVGGRDAVDLEDMSDQVTLVVIAPIELGTVDRGEMRGKPEMLEDRAGEDMRLRGREPQRIAVGLERPHRVGDTLIKLRLEHRPSLIARAIEGERLLDTLPPAEQLLEARTQGGPDHPVQRREIGNRCTDLAECILHRADDALCRLGDGPVEIEQHMPTRSLLPGLFGARLAAYTHDTNSITTSGSAPCRDNRPRRSS